MAGVNLSTVVKVTGLAAMGYMLMMPLIEHHQRKSMHLKPIKVEKTTTSAPSVKKKALIPEKPKHQVKLPDFAKITDVKEKKRQFFNFLRPAVVKENEHLLRQRKKIAALLDKLQASKSLSGSERNWLSDMVSHYQVNEKMPPQQQLIRLLTKVDQIPMELVLVQAANESAWGTSRFAKIGLNFFGIWCFRPNCGMIPNGRQPGQKHEVAAFKTVEQAVRRYFYNINTNSAYDLFRTIRAQLRQEDQPLSADILASGLLPYSERGADYVIELTEMIRHNRAYLN